MLHADTALESSSVHHLDQFAENGIEVAMAVDPALHVTDPVFGLEAVPIGFKDQVGVIVPARLDFAKDDVVLRDLLLEANWQVAAEVTTVDPWP